MCYFLEVHVFAHCIILSKSYNYFFFSQTARNKIMAQSSTMVTAQFAPNACLWTLNLTKKTYNDQRKKYLFLSCHMYQCEILTVNKNVPWNIVNPPHYIRMFITLNFYNFDFSQTKQKQQCCFVNSPVHVLITRMQILKIYTTLSVRGVTYTSYLRNVTRISY